MAYHEIVWKPEYEIGISEIDDQHKKLLEIANNFLKAKSEGKAAEVLKQTFVDLIDYTKVHFKAEEDEMLKENYVALDHHKKQHKKLIDQIVSVLTHIKEGKAYALDELADVIKEWLINHIIVEDGKFRKYIGKTALTNNVSHP